MSEKLVAVVRVDDEEEQEANGERVDAREGLDGYNSHWLVNGASSLYTQMASA